MGGECREWQPVTFRPKKRFLHEIPEKKLFYQET
jgi:hypothetical protein